ncbi:hypothetical protein ACT3TC_15145 [Halomonas sp. AOP27-A1-41]|uniref:hypothetical protein n=1 Tax=Halomonas sp. AOP27-A1-41 TaxID=3457707 RepID=UPI00403427CA
MNDPSMADLVAALQEQTAAINRLAESNQQVIDYLLAQEAEETGADLEGPSYLDLDD